MLAEENIFSSILNVVWSANLVPEHDKATVDEVIKTIASGNFPLKKLAALTSETQNTLEKRCYRLLEKSRDGEPSFHLFMNTQVIAHFLRFNYPRFCPDCFKSDPYHRFYWDFSPLTCCPIHKKLLVDICPACHAQLTWSRPYATKCKCGYDLADFDAIDVPDEQMEHVYLIAKAINRCDMKTQPLVNFMLLENYASIVSFAHRELSPPNYLRVKALKPRPKLWPLPTRSELIHVPIIKAGDFSDLNIPHPESRNLTKLHSLRDIHSYLIEQRLLNTTSRNTKKIGPHLQWQPNAEVHRTMVEVFTGKQVDLLVDYTRQGKITKRQHARHLGVKNEGYNFRSRLRQSKRINDFFVTAEDRDEILDLRSAAVILDISEYLIRQIVFERIISPISGPTIDGFGDYKFTRNELRELCNSLSNMVVSADLADESIAIRDYNTQKTGRRDKFTNIIKAALDGSIKVTRVPSYRLSDIELSLESIKIFTTKASIQSGYLTVRDISSELNIYKDAVYRTMETGLLPFTKNGTRKLVHEQDFQEFNEKFCFIKELATQYKCNPTNLADKIMDEGILPVSGPKVDSNLVYIFKRDDIEKIDITEIINKRTYKARTGRIAKSDYSKSYKKLLVDLSLITTSEAAEILEISSQKLGKLIKSGELNLYVNEALPSYKKYIKSTDLQSYITRYRQNPELVSIEKASKLMDETPEIFYTSWVKFKRIRTIDDGLGTKYVKRQELQELEDFKKKAISINEAAKLKGVDRSYFSNLLKLGKMKPTSGPGVDDYGNYFLDRQEVEAHTNKSWW